MNNLREVNDDILKEFVSVSYKPIYVLKYKFMEVFCHE